MEAKELALSSHLIVNHEQVVIKCQCGSGDHQSLVEGLVSSTDYEVTAERTFAVVLMTG